MLIWILPVFNIYLTFRPEWSREPQGFCLETGLENLSPPYITNKEELSSSKHRRKLHLIYRRLRVRDLFNLNYSKTMYNLCYEQCCGSGMSIPDPGSKNSNKREGWKKICCDNFFCSHKFKKIENYFIFELLKKKFWADFQIIIELFTQKIVTNNKKYSISGKNLFRIPGPGVKKAPDPGSATKNKPVGMSEMQHLIIS